MSIIQTLRVTCDCCKEDLMGDYTELVYERQGWQFCRGCREGVLELLRTKYGFGIEVYGVERTRYASLRVTSS